MIWGQQHVELAYNVNSLQLQSPKLIAMQHQQDALIMIQCVMSKNQIAIFIKPPQATKLHTAVN